MHNFSNFHNLQADISRSSLASDDSSPPLSSTTSISKLRISVAQIQKSRMKPPSQILNSAKGFSLGQSSLFKRRAMGESVRENYDSMDSLRMTPTVEDKDLETERMVESAYEPRTSNMRHNRRTSIRRNSLVSKERIQELADLNFDDDRKLVQAILREKPEIRHEDEVRFIQKVLEPIKFFTQIKKDLHHKAYKKMFEKLTLEEYGPGIQITDQHTYGKKFYVILEGEVYLMKEKETTAQIVEEEKPTFKRKERSKLKRSIRRESLSIENLLDLEEYLKKETNEDKKKVKLETYFANMCLTKTLTQGDSFGEPASLRSKDYPKAISMITKEKTILGVIDFVDYEEILGQMYQSRIIQRVNMLMSFEMFKHWSHNLLSKLIEQMEEVSLHRHQEIYNQGDYPNYLYFILEGEVELRKTTVAKTSIYDEESCFTTPIEKLKVKPSPAGEKVRLAILSQGNCFGESEFLSKQPRDHGAVVFSQETQLLYITREKFGWFAVDKETKNSLKALSDSKKTLYENRVTNFVPINQMLTKLNTENIAKQVEKENVTRSKSPQSPKLKFLQPPPTSTTKKSPQERTTTTRRTNKAPFSFFTYADKKQPSRPQTALNRSGAIFLNSKTHEKQPFSRSQATSPKNFQTDLLLDKSLIKSLAASPKTEAVLSRTLIKSRPTSPTGVIEKRIGTAVMKSRANNENNNHAKSKVLIHERDVGGSTIDLDLETEQTTVLNFVKPNRQAATHSDLSKINLELPKAILKNFSFFEPKTTKKDAATETKLDDYKKEILIMNDTKVTEEPKKKDLRKILKFVSRPVVQNYYALRVQSFSPQNHITFHSPKALNLKSQVPLRVNTLAHKIEDNSSLKIEPDSGRVIKYESYLMDKFSNKAHRASRHGGNRLHSAKNRSQNSSPVSWVGGNVSNFRK